MGATDELQRPHIASKIQAALSKMDEAGHVGCADMLLPQIKAVLESGIAPASMVKSEMETAIEVIAESVESCKVH